jgi:hypothetical protein
MREELPDRPRYEGEITIKWQTLCFVSSQLVVGRWPQPWSTMSRPNIYQKLFEAYCKAYSDKKKGSCQKELNKKWESIKSSSENKPLLIKPKAEE